VNRLIRVSYGPFQLGELAPAAVEEVNMRVLREQIGEKVERRAGADFSAPLREREDEPPQKPPRPLPAPSAGKAPRAPSSSPPARGRWKSKRNAARGRGPQR
jgi:23S rRNA pseudouridine2605 synthase